MAIAIVIGLLLFVAAIIYFGFAASLVASAYYLLNAAGPLLILLAVGALLLYVAWKLVKSEILITTMVVIMFVVGLIGFWQYDSYSEYVLAKSDYFGYTQIEGQSFENVKTLPSSFKFVPKAQAEKIKASLISGTASVDTFSPLMSAYDKEGTQLFVYESYPKRAAQLAVTSQFPVYGIVNNDIETLTQASLLPSGGLLNSDLPRALREQSFLSFPDLNDLRWVETSNGEWYLVVPNWNFRWDGLFRNLVWDGNFFVKGNNITYLTREYLSQSTEFGGLNIIPQEYSKHAAKLFELYNSKNYLDIALGKAPNLQPTSIEADHGVVTEDGIQTFAQFEFLKPSGDSSQVSTVLYNSATGVKYKNVAPLKVKDIIVTPDEVLPKAQTYVLSSTNLVKLTGANANSLASWEVGEFVPVFERGQLWYMYFVYGSHDKGSVNALIGIRANSDYARSNTQVSDVTEEDVVLFKNAAQIGQWLEDGTLPVIQDSGFTSNASDTGLAAKIQELQTQNREILELLKQMKTAG
jgi:hypothetical protein